MKRQIWLILKIMLFAMAVYLVFRGYKRLEYNLEIKRRPEKAQNAKIRRNAVTYNHFTQKMGWHDVHDYMEIRHSSSAGEPEKVTVGYIIVPPIHPWAGWSCEEINRTLSSGSIPLAYSEYVPGDFPDYWLIGWKLPGELTLEEILSAHESFIANADSSGRREHLLKPI